MELLKHMMRLQNLELILLVEITTKVTGAGSSVSFRLHNNYSDAIAADYLGINTISITAGAAAGVVTFRQLDVNFAENSATIVKTGDAGGATGEVNANTFIDGIDIPATTGNACD